MSTNSRTLRTRLRKRKSTPLPVRFWRKVDKNGPPSWNGIGQCWVWVGAKQGGYGVTSDKPNDRSSLRTHRVSWELENGPIPDGLWVLHHCDNRACVRPDHLFLGTAKDNTRDMVAKGRATGPRNPPMGKNHWRHRRPEMVPRGEGNHASKLTEADVVDIRARYAAGEQGKDLAVEHGVCRRTVYNLIKRRTWAHVT